MEIIKTEIEGLVILKPKIFGDDRGYFYESFRDDFIIENICENKFIQENESCSSYGVIRGLHFQKPPHAQSKLVKVVKGKVLDVAVDIRKDSPTFGKHVAVELSEESNLQFFIPRGFAHGFAVLSETAVFQYKCDNYYSPQSEGSIIWNDPTLNIDWGIPLEKILVSEKDRNNLFFTSNESTFN